MIIMSEPYFNNVPPHCAPFECSEIVQYSTLLPSLSFVNLGDDLTDLGGADSIRHGFRKTNANFLAVHDVLRHFTNTYGKYRENTGVTYTLSAFAQDEQISRPMEVGDALYFSTSSHAGSALVDLAEEFPDGAWRYSQAVSGNASETLGIVSDVDCNCFSITFNGYISGGFTTPLLPGATYFLDPYNPGRPTLTNPTGAFQVSKPLFTAISSDEVIVDIKRGVLVANFSEWS